MRESTHARYQINQTPKSMEEFFGYLRVSTKKQGTHGVSLLEQREAIDEYARRSELRIARWFEDQLTAAKGRRPAFSAMLALLRRGRARGVIIHKVDRSARNLRDWADLGELIDAGVDVRFASENLDLTSRGGRLSADIQAIVSADYVRNLREEVRKGQRGRLKQGLYPWPAPVGYRDMGKGNAKEPDPATAPMVRKAFELYATGQYSLPALAHRLRQHGFRNTRGGFLSVNGLSILLNNPFYIGLIRVQKRNQTFRGAHEPLVSAALFDRVQGILRGRTVKGTGRHHFVFRRLLRCSTCGYGLTGELQRGHVYYRCHWKHADRPCTREEDIQTEIQRSLGAISLTDEEYARILLLLSADEDLAATAAAGRREALVLRQQRLKDQQQRLTDAYLEGVLAKDEFEQRRRALDVKKSAVEEELGMNDAARSSGRDSAREFFERAKGVQQSYFLAVDAEKREILSAVTSNILVSRENVSVELRIPFATFGNRPLSRSSALERETFRTPHKLEEPTTPRSDEELKGLYKAVSRWYRKHGFNDPQ